ncbi:MAG TPA: DUF3298 domain-containing protein [Candidatus Omnitrophota bacterium]|nr:DUF3298 domain-containing protein [Candidatus Omnitrophota bacterium]
MARFKTLFLVLIILALIAYRLFFYVPGGIVIEKKIKTSRFDMVYPQISHSTDEATKNAINRLLYSEAFQFSEDKDLTKDEQKDSNYYVRSYIKRYTPPILSIRYDESFMALHMAHPMNGVRAVTINADNGRVYALKDLFVKGVDHKAVLNAVTSAILQKKGEVLLYPYAGITKDQEFYLTNNSLVILFQEYTYTTHAEGALEIPVPLSDIKDKLDPLFR